MYSINLAGMLFHINRDAYETLKEYLSAIERQFPGQEGKEIQQEIETRLAELFSEKITDQKQVILLEDVKEVIEIIGRPEELNENQYQEKEEKTMHATKRLYRDPDNRVLGGVCSGMGAYFNVDPILIRFIFILFTLLFASGLLIYLIIWLVTPEARTLSQKREMRGEQFNFGQFRQKAKSEYEDIKNNLNL